ncbi:hypothetical protein E2C01_064124 [Portunus trituberculatus]|uniref:Uncharacterized protein n=1 Tax=Portunus trituberculatus TaxID=210409 RepID=A0A5B7HFF7_PORTR|nr:hypothetical protein [Portunus trituberculatus]
MEDTAAKPAKLPSPGNPPGSGAALSPIPLPPTRPKETGMAGAGSPQTPEDLPERGAARRLNPPTPGPATEEIGSAGACKPLNSGATPGSWAACNSFHRDLKTPWKHLT